MAKPETSVDRGQSLLESLLMLPLFLAAAFLGLQVAHIGFGLGLVSYATASAARAVVQADDEGAAAGKFATFMMAGLEEPQIQPYPASGGSGPSVTKDVQFIGCATLPVYPLVGPFVGHALTRDRSGACGPNTPLVSLSEKRFKVRAKTTVRMNYQPG